jgi:hypothetical protein
VKITSHSSSTLLFLSLLPSGKTSLGLLHFISQKGHRSFSSSQKPSASV